MELQRQNTEESARFSFGETDPAYFAETTDARCPINSRTTLIFHYHEAKNKFMGDEKTKHRSLRLNTKETDFKATMKAVNKILRQPVTLKDAAFLYLLRFLFILLGFMVLYIGIFIVLLAIFNPLFIVLIFVGVYFYVSWTRRFWGQQYYKERRDRSIRQYLAEANQRSFLKASIRLSLGTDGKWLQADLLSKLNNSITFHDETTIVQPVVKKRLTIA